MIRLTNQPTNQYLINTLSYKTHFFPYIPHFKRTFRRIHVRVRDVQNLVHTNVLVVVVFRIAVKSVRRLIGRSTKQTAKES